MYKRLIILAVTFAFMFSVLYMRIYVIVRNDDYIETGKIKAFISLRLETQTEIFTTEITISL